MNFRQYKKIAKELLKYKKLKNKRLYETVYFDNEPVIVIFTEKEFRRIVKLQKIFYRRIDYKKLNRIGKYEKEKHRRIIEHLNRNNFEKKFKEDKNEFYFRGSKNLCVGVIE